MPTFVNKSALKHYVFAAGSNVVVDCRVTNCFMIVTWKGTGLLSRRLIVEVPLQTVSKVEPKDNKNTSLIPVSILQITKNT